MARRGGPGRLLRACVPVLVAALALLPASTAEAAAAPTITVTPSTNLVDLQLVAVAGKNFTANAIIATLECAATATTEAGCDLGTLVEVNDTSAGTFSVSRYVRRIITLTTGEVDCAKPGVCAMAAADISKTAEHAGALLTFNPKIPPARPKVTATPSNGLVDHQPVQVTGSGMVPDTVTQVFQCQAGVPLTYSTCDTSTTQDVTVGTNGHFSTTWIAHRLIELPPLSVLDCASKPGACVVASGNLFGKPGPAAATLSFNPAIPPLAQHLNVTPDTSLIDHKLVHLEGGGFTPGAQIAIIQCQAGATSEAQCDASTLTYATAGFLGHFSITYPVHRIIRIGGGTFDCASRPGACILAAANQARAFEAASQPLSFNPSVPPVVASVTVTPHTDLFDNELVTVVGKGFTPFALIQLSECSARVLTQVTPFGYCANGPAPAVSATRTGTFAIEMFVHVVIATPDGLVGCASKSGACIIEAVRSAAGPVPTSGDLAFVPLTFH